MPARVYLQPSELARKSAHHTAYVGDGAITEGKPQPLYKLEFMQGVAKDVPDELYQRFKDAGIAGTSRPHLDRVDD